MSAVFDKDKRLSEEELVFDNTNIVTE